MSICIRSHWRFLEEYHVKKALEEGLMVLTAKDKVRLLPPLTITYDEIDQGVEILKKALS